MRREFAIVGGSANRGSARTGIKNAGSGNTQKRIVETAKNVSLGKTWGYLSELTGLKERVAKHRVSSTRALKPDEIAALLQSEQGIHFLVAIMDDARPAWWRTLLRMGILGGIEARRESDLNLLRKVAHVSDQTAAELPAALLLQDQDFYGPVFEALDAVARRPNSALGASPKGKA